MLRWRSLLKITVWGVGLWAIYRMWSLVLLFLVSLLLAIVLHPAIPWLQRRRLPRSAAMAVVVFLVLAAFVAVAGFLVPAVGRELVGVITQLPAIRADVEHAAQSSELLRRGVALLEELAHNPKLRARLTDPSLWGQIATEAAGVPVAIIVALYLLADGPRVYAWLLAYIPRERRARVSETADGVAKVVYAYLRGQVITSVLVGIYSFATLRLLHVQAALLLSVLAALFDIIPFIGFISFTIPAALVALLTSPGAALAIVLLYAGYHVVENYVIVPRVYGRQMRLSTLTVLIALGVGGALSGVLGALLALPIVAAYPIVERLWLRPTVGDEAIEDHAALDRSVGDKEHRTVDRVIEGEEHPDAH